MSDDFTSATFNRYLSEHKLMGARCTQCGSLYLPPRAICPSCHSDRLRWTELSGRGRLAAFTSITIAPSVMIADGFDRNHPYCTGIVELDEGVKISARLLGVDAKNPTVDLIGRPVSIEFIERGEGDLRQTVLAFRAA